MDGQGDLNDLFVLSKELICIKVGLRKCRDGQSKLDGMCSVLLWQVQGKLVFLFKGWTAKRV